MTIQKGEEWGRQGTVPSSFIIAEDDSDAATQPPHTPFALCRGDMFTALGNPRLPVHHAECMILPVDAMECTISFTNGETEEVNAISHVAVGSWWRGRLIVVSNSGFWCGLNISPRSHPNDGGFDTFTMSSDMPFQQRFLARRRSRTGTHLPHPNIKVVREKSCVITRESPKERLSIDDVAVSNWQHISITIVPDYWDVMV